MRFSADFAGDKPDCCRRARMKRSRSDLAQEELCTVGTDGLRTVETPNAGVQVGRTCPYVRPYSQHSLLAKAHRF